MSRPRLSCKFLALVFLLCLNNSAAQTENPPDSLPPGKPVQREIGNGETHSYTLTLSAGQYAYVVVNQKGVDVVVTAYGPDVLMRLHKQNPSAGLDRAAFNASETGRARSLLELLTEASTEIRHGVDPALLERERSVGEAIAKQAADQIRLLSGKHTEEEANAVAKKLTTLTTDYEQIQSRIRESSPQYVALVQPVPLKVEDTTIGARRC